MANRVTGRYETNVVGGETIRAFIPFPLPPVDPSVEIEGRLAEANRAAERALGQLDLAGDLVPSLDWFIYAFVRKEAVVSAQIEGIQTTLMDLLRHEAADETREPDLDVAEVCNYLDALGYARAQLKDPRGLPISRRLLDETHRILLRGERGEHKAPGEVRRSQNWIGGSRPGNAAFVPPPPRALADLLSEFEHYLHRDQGLPPLIRIGLLHVQFETIHPYLDGNGRLGRLLITLLLEHWQLLERPLLYLSLHFKRHRQAYYRRLDAVRVEGDWEGWLEFFLEGVEMIADEALTSARDLFALVTDDRQRVLRQSGVTLPAVQLFEALPGRPLVTVNWVVRALDVSKPTAGRAIGSLEEAGVLTEVTGRQRDRVFAYQGYLDRLRRGTELQVDGPEFG